VFSRRYLLLGLLLLPAGCNSQQSQTTSNKFPVDGIKREVSLKQPAKRVIAIGPAAVEIMFALGAEDLLVGRDDYADFPAEAKKVPIAGTYQGPNIEQCIALRPDIVIVQFEGMDKARLDEWQKKIGVPVAAIGAITVKEAGVEIQKIADWIGKSEKAKPLTLPLNESPAIKWKKSRAFIEIGRSPLFTAGPNTLVGNAVEVSGFENVAKVRGYQAYNLENLTVDAPDVYIVPTKDSREQTLRQLRANQSLSKLKCIQTGRVIVIDPDLILRPGPRLKTGISTLQKASQNLAEKPNS
jgi:iron complex transport system substrate-binding protein